MSAPELAAFLLARIAEDEAVTQVAVARNGATWSTHKLQQEGARITGTTEFGNPRSYRGDGELWDDEGALGMFEETADHIARWDPARVLAECEAKRRIVELHRAAEDEFTSFHYGASTGSKAAGDLDNLNDGDPACATCGEFSEYGVPWPCPTLRLLALPYAYHPDYRAEWAL